MAARPSRLTADHSCIRVPPGVDLQLIHLTTGGNRRAPHHHPPGTLLDRTSRRGFVSNLGALRDHAKFRDAPALVTMQPDMLD